MRRAPPAKHTCFRSSCERRGRRSWRPLLLLSFGEAFLTGVGASLPKVTSEDARLRRRYTAFCGRILRPNVPAFAPPVSGYVAGVGAYFFRCPPAAPSLQELVHLFPALAPGTHGFAGGNLPFAAGSSGLAYLLSLLLRAARSQELTLTSSAVLRRSLPYRSWCIYSKSYLRGRTASPEVTCH